MPTTSDFNAGLDSSNVQVVYKVESAFAAKPSGNFDAIRLTSESLSETKTRGRPDEIRSDGQVSAAVTQSVEASGSVEFAFTYGTYDEWLSGLLNADWATAVSISVANKITVAAATDGNAGTLTHDDANGFQALKVGQWIRLSVTDSSDSSNNKEYTARVKTLATMNKVMTLEFASQTVVAAAKASTTTVKIKGQIIRNDVVTKTYHIEKKFASNLFLVYAGSYISGGSINFEQGDFMQGNFDFLCSSEAAGATSIGGTIQKAPTGKVIDTVNGVSRIEQNGAAWGSIIQSVSLDITKENARQQFGIGSPNARGMGRGTFSVSGSLSAYFNNLTLYNLYKNETEVAVSWLTEDSDGNGYYWTLPGVTLMNPSIVAGGPDTDIIAEFELEANPTTIGGELKTMQIDKLAKF